MNDAAWHRVVRKRRKNAALLQCSPRGVRRLLLAHNTVVITITLAGDHLLLEPPAAVFADRYASFDGRLRGAINDGRPETVES